MPMKFRINKRRALLAAVNAVSLAGFTAFMLTGASQAKSQHYNFAAERWQNGGKTDYAQISCFFGDNSGFTTDSLGSVRAGILSSLQTISVVPEEGQKLCPDAYSAPVGQATVKGDISGRSEADITAVGGDFFLIHDFRLLDGAFFSDEDLMQDGAVIDRNLAWALYGSHDVAGMNMTINGTQFYISGVIETPKTEEEIKCAGELPKVYISYDGASGFSAASADIYADFVGGESGNTAAEKFTKITCYEVLMPNPVENFAYQSVKSIMLGWECSTVQNTGRFDMVKRLRAIEKLPSQIVRKNGVYYPYWENASRMVQFRLSFVYLGAVICLIIPLLTVLGLGMKALRLLKKYKKLLMDKMKDLPDKIRVYLKGKRYEKQKNS